MDTLGSSQHSWVKTCHRRVDRGWNAAQRKCPKNGVHEKWQLKSLWPHPLLQKHLPVCLKFKTELDGRMNKNSPWSFCTSCSWGSWRSGWLLSHFFLQCHCAEGPVLPLIYWCTQNFTINKLNEIMAWPDHTHSKHIYLLFFFFLWVYSFQLLLRPKTITINV